MTAESTAALSFTFESASESLRALAGGNMSVKALRQIEGRMGRSMFQIAEDYLGVKVKAPAVKEGETDAEKAAREDAEALTHGESVAQAMREFSLCKACSLILAMTDIGQEGLDSLSLQQIGELYRLAIGAFMDAFAAFNGQKPKSKGEEGKASAT